MKIKLELDYRGEGFCGWQVQPGLSSIQGELERAIAIFLRAQHKKMMGADCDYDVSVTGSGRTDAGVHAKGQIASFSWPNELPLDSSHLLRAINALTPRALVVKDVSVQDDDFDARRSAHVKCYKYTMLLREGSFGYYMNGVWCLGRSKLNIAAMIQAARYLKGQRDFSSFRARDCCAKSSVRTIVLSEISRKSSDLLVYTVYGSGFLKQMIRIIVGTLVDVGRERITIDDFKRIVQTRDRKAAGITAPACGLVLQWVRYQSSIDFQNEKLS